MSEENSYDDNILYKNLESEIFSSLKVNTMNNKSIFIIGAPRTGSTILYQLLISNFKLSYISNYTNNYLANMPIIGIALTDVFSTKINLQNSYGKTNGLLQPSEGSSVMRRWFGGGHPSQLLSTQIKDKEMENHFIHTIVASNLFLNKPLVIKNAWNCFRIKYIGQKLKDSRFIWIIRDIRDAAMSDLMARHITKNGNINAWNSATPANYELLQKLKPDYQVVENQYEFNKTIEENSHTMPAGKVIRIWYEDLLANPHKTIDDIGKFLEIEKNDNEIDFTPSLYNKNNKDGPRWCNIDRYVHDNIARLGPYVRM